MLLSFLYLYWLFPLSARTKPPRQGMVLFEDLLGKKLSPRACIGDGGSIRRAPAFINETATSPVLIDYSYGIGRV